MKNKWWDAMEWTTGFLGGFSIGMTVGAAMAYGISLAVWFFAVGFILVCFSGLLAPHLKKRLIKN